MHTFIPVPPVPEVARSGLLKAKADAVRAS